ncbi:transglutaminase-like cysteine peptidase [Enterovirga sp.]|jgi:predicted transglutaminase-like cysteine proteinase|uniref:transglutaminase-like cysteine peptidase n=1 Tax=Enterovirga sp. TaxID=2026350 RepID=UPI00261DCF2C|nr:transglutaminase-like cysteine peptidase [Enterovirga sp.]MDB5592778.1 transglutaminase [Enterovirga sp.]
MFKTTRTIISIGLSALALIAGAATANSQSLARLSAVSTPAPVGGEARPLAAWAEFCRRVPAECSVNPAEPATVTLTARVWQQIVSVNRQVNSSIRAVTDEEHWAVADRWDIPTDGAGDCEDFQLLKRKLLTEQGLPRRAMRMTVVVDEKGEGHAVLIIRTHRGDLVLDNKTDTVMPWFDTGYIFVKRESEDRLGWVSLGGAVSPTVTANR